MSETDATKPVVTENVDLKNLRAEVADVGKALARQIDRARIETLNRISSVEGKVDGSADEIRPCV